MLRAAVVAVLLTMVPAPHAHAGVPPDDPASPAGAQGPLILSPPGCVVPVPAIAVFRGRVINIDDPPTTAQFRVLSMLAGSLDGYAPVNRVLVVYGQEASFLEIGVEYIVGVRPALDSDRLVSKILRPAPLFGGDAVIGLEDSDLECPRVEDPVSTLLSDGSAVDSGVFTPLHDSRSQLVGAVVEPLLIALAVLLGLVLLKELLFSIGRSLRESVGSTVPLKRDRRHAARATSAPGGERAT